MSLEIKLCGVNDIEDIEIAINNVKTEEDECRSNKEAIIQFLANENNLFYIAKENDKVVSYAIAYIQNRLDTTKKMINLYEIGTLKACRKKGYAKQVIQYIIDTNKNSNICKMWIPTNISNVAACSLYRSIGAKEPEEKDEIIYTYRYQ